MVGAVGTIDTRVDMTFRRLSTTDGIHNYFGKTRRVRLALAGGGA